MKSKLFFRKILPEPYKLKWLFLMLLFVSNKSFAQAVKKINFSYSPPKNFSILDTASGDFNQDSLADYIVILKNNFEDNNPDTTRPLLILFGNKLGKLTTFARNDSVVLCKNCGGVRGDPYQGISVSKNNFSINHYGGSGWVWTRNITFKYIKSLGKFMLYKDGGVSFQATDENTKSTNFFIHKETFGKLVFEKFSYAHWD